MYTCTFSRTISNIVHDHGKTVSARIIDSNGDVMAHAYFCKQFQIASIVHDNVGTISGVIIDFHGPGVEDTMLADDFQ